MPRLRKFAIEFGAIRLAVTRAEFASDESETGDVDRDALEKQLQNIEANIDCIRIRMETGQ